MTKVVCLPLLLGGLLLAGCSRKESSTEASSSPAPAKPVGVSADSVAVDAPPAESAPPPPAAGPDAGTPETPIKLPPILKTDGPPATMAAEGASARGRRPVTNPTQALAAMNKALRAYLSAHEQQLPPSVEDLTGGGLIGAIPDAPSGMAFVIDAARREVVLKKQ